MSLQSGIQKVGVSIFLGVVACFLPITFAAADAVIASDGQSSVELPAGWEKMAGLNEKAELEVGASRVDQYLVVLTENKDDFVNMDLDQFSKVTTRSIIDSLKDPTVSEPKRTQVNGKQAVQTEIVGALDNLKIGYIHTAIEGTKNYYQVLTWTRKSSFEGNSRAVLDGAISSFKEIVK